jgi:hypothetical protein
MYIYIYVYIHTHVYIYIYRSFIDYEPVTGRGLRNALRQELNMRVETGPLFMSAFTGQVDIISIYVYILM